MKFNLVLPYQEQNLVSFCFHKFVFGVHGQVGKKYYGAKLAFKEQQWNLTYDWVVYKETLSDGVGIE